MMAAAVIDRTRGGMREVLIGKLPDAPYAGLWCFPFGPIEQGEMPEPALRRSLRTMLGINVRIVCAQPPFDQTFDDMTFRWRFFFCEASGEKMHNMYFDQVRWVPRASLREYDFDPVSRHVVDWILEDPHDE